MLFCIPVAVLVKLSKVIEFQYIGVFLNLTASFKIIIKDKAKLVLLKGL